MLGTCSVRCQDVSSLIVAHGVQLNIQFVRRIRSMFLLGINRLRIILLILRIMIILVISVLIIIIDISNNSIVIAILSRPLRPSAC